MRREVIVFARPPRAGRVKTRLAADLGAEAAARVYRVLLEQAVRVACQGTEWQTSVAWSERPSRGMAARCSVPWDTQAGGDLGERMARSFEDRFRRGVDRVLLVGSDIPGIALHLLREAFARLEECRVVLGPAGDGGYWLVGQRAPGVDLFAGVPWSSPWTLEATRDRLRSLGVERAELPVVEDVDTVEDLRRILATGATEPRVARALREAMAGGGG